MTTTVGHPDRLAEQINIILAQPESWDQGSWHSECGTKHCIAGHGQIASGSPMDNETCETDAQAWYGLNDDDAEWLFQRDRTLTELYEFARLALAGEAYFDADGCNSKGFDRDGYDRYGFRSDGYDSYGFDRSGFDRSGFDRSGFDRSGFDRCGFDRCSFKRDGFDSYGYNRHGLDRDGDILPLLNIAAGGTP